MVCIGQVDLFFLSAFPLFATYYWYFVWVNKLIQIDGLNYLFLGQSLSESLHSFMERPTDFFMSFVYGLQFVSFLFLIVGMIRLFFEKIGKELFYGILISLVLMLVFIIKAGDTFMTLSYYVIPIIPILSILVAFGITWIKKVVWRNIFLAAIAIECLLSHQHQFFSADKDADLMELESILDRVDSSDFFIAITGDLNPESLYYSHRRGWVLSNSHAKKDEIINKLKIVKCKYLVNRKSKGMVHLKAPVIFEDGDFKIYQLNQ